MSASSPSKIFQIPIDPLTSRQALGRIERAIKSHDRLWVATVNTEWLMQSRHDRDFRQRLLRTNLRLADGSGVLWAAHFLALPWRGRLWSIWQMAYSGTSLIFYPPFCRRTLPETVSGSRLVTELAHAGDRYRWKIFLLGGAPGVAVELRARWEAEFPHLRVEVSDADPDEDRGVAAVKQFEPDLILIAYSADDQLAWLDRHLKGLPPAVGIGIGGSFDYLVGGSPKRIGTTGKVFKARPAPAWINSLGLEWLWRLFTQPWRWRRIITAVPLFIGSVLQYRTDQMSNPDPR